MIMVELGAYEKNMYITLYIIISLVVSWIYESGNYSSCNLKKYEYDKDMQKKDSKNEKFTIYTF